MQNKNWEKIFVFLALGGLFLIGANLIKPNLHQNTPKTVVSFLNVGQGDATLISTPNGHYVLIDGGPDKSVLSELGRNLPPTVHNLDAVILSHPHADHVTGLDYLFDRYNVGKVYLTGAVHNAPEYREFLAKIKDQNIQAYKTYKGQNFEVDGVSFRCLYPETDLAGKSFKDQNEGSNVYDVSYQNDHVLMLGDLPAKDQSPILSDKVLASKYDIMKVSHHGSKTGTLDAMLLATHPKYSVISDGVDNSYGFPAPSTLKQLIGTIIFRTDQRGTINFTLDSAGVHPD